MTICRRILLITWSFLEGSLHPSASQPMAWSLLPVSPTPVRSFAQLQSALFFSRPPPATSMTFLILSDPTLLLSLPRLTDVMRTAYDLGSRYMLALGLEHSSGTLSSSQEISLSWSFGSFHPFYRQTALAPIRRCPDHIAINANYI